MTSTTYDHQVNDLFLTIINRGEDYKDRLGIARSERNKASPASQRLAAGLWLAKVEVTAEWMERQFKPDEPYTARAILQCAVRLSEYYEEHLSEME